MTDFLSERSEKLEKYNLAEMKGIQRIPNIAIEAFSLNLWNITGFPYKIRTIDELWRYHDGMHRFDSVLNRSLPIAKEASLEDLNILEKAADIVLKFSEYYKFPTPTPATINLIKNFSQYLILKKNHPDMHSKKCTIFEVGPGTGYLGLILGIAGHSYIALEASQAFYLYQSYLLEFAFKEKYCDGLNGIVYKNISHIPWWEFNKEGFTLPKLDLITINNAIREMNPTGFRHVLYKTFGSPNNSKGGMKIISNYLGNSTVGGEALISTLHQFQLETREIEDNVFITKKSDKPGLFYINRRSILGKILHLQLKFLKKVKNYLFLTTSNKGSSYKKSSISIIKDSNDPVCSLMKGFKGYEEESANTRYLNGDW